MVRTQKLTDLKDSDSDNFEEIITTPEKKKKAKKKKKVVMAQHDDVKEYEVTDERSDTHMPVASRDPSDAWMEKFLKRLDLRWKDDPREKEAKGKQETDERGHNEDGHEE